MEKLGRYQLVRRIATGGMAEVYLAKNVGAAGIAKTCVVKRILPHLATNLEFATMFLNEARISAQLSHPNIVQFMDLGQDGESFFLAMEYVDGPTVRGLIHGARALGRTVPAPIALKIASQALEGLGYAHGYADASGRHLKLVHRDISPHNLLLARTGTVKVADFGIAKAATIPSITKTGQIKGKVRYMSPEQLYDDPLDARSDLFAVGLTLFELLTSHRPFHGEADAEVMKAIATEPHEPLSTYLDQVPPGLQALLDRALAKERDERYASAAEMQADVEALLLRSGAVVRGAEIAAAIKELVPPELKPTGAEASLVDVRPMPRPAAPPAPEPRTQVARRSREVPLPAQEPGDVVPTIRARVDTVLTTQREVDAEPPAVTSPSAASATDPDVVRAITRKTWLPWAAGALVLLVAAAIWALR